MTQKQSNDIYIEFFGELRCFQKCKERCLLSLVKNNTLRQQEGVWHVYHFGMLENDTNLKYFVNRFFTMQLFC